MKKLFLSLLTLLYSYTLILSPIHAQSPSPAPWWSPTFGEFSQKVKTAPPTEIFGERYTVAQISWIINGIAYLVNEQAFSPEFYKAMSEIITNVQSPPSGAGSIADKDDLTKSASRMGLPGLLAISMGEAFSTPPSSGISSIASGLEVLNIIPPSYAQTTGFGFSSLKGVEKLWTASRNISMVMVSIIMIASGFMIMFKIKINPQTVISIQTLIPKLISTLILIFFSFAIAGLVIDFTYLVVGLGITLLSSSGALPSNLSTPELIGWFTEPNFGKVLLYFLLPLAILFILMVALQLIPGIGQLASALGGFWLTLGLIVLALWVFWLLLKVWWTIVKSYISLLVYIVLGPWYIMMGLIPTQKGFSDWLKHIIAEASTFVVIPLMLAINMVFWQLPKWMYDGISAGASAIPIPGLGEAVKELSNNLAPINVVDTTSGAYPKFPLYGGGDGLFFQIIFGYLILSLMPVASKMVKDAIGVKEFAYMSAIDQPINTATKFGKGYVSSKLGEFSTSAKSANARALAKGVQKALDTDKQ